MTRKSLTTQHEDGKGGGMTAAAPPCPIDCPTDRRMNQNANT